MLWRLNISVCSSQLVCQVCDGKEQPGKGLVLMGRKTPVVGLPHSINLFNSQAYTLGQRQKRNGLVDL